MISQKKQNPVVHDCFASVLIAKFEGITPIAVMLSGKNEYGSLGPHTNVFNDAKKIPLYSLD